MKIRFTFCFLIFLAFINSCTEEETILPKKEETPPFSPQLVNWAAMNSEAWKNMSFPVWFSKALLDSNHIEEIEIKFTNYNFTDTISNITDTFPSKRIQLKFDQKGNPKKVNIFEYLDGIQLTEHIFSYPSPIDSLGYSPSAVSSNVKYREKSMFSFLNTVKELQQYKRLIFKDFKDSVLHYLDESSKNETHHYFLLDSSNWNVSYLDLHFEPDGKNIFYYGSPKNYISSFTLKDLVNKSKRQERFYYPNKVLKAQYFHTFDFVTKRVFNYNSKGVPMSFKDSLITQMGDFLHKEVGDIKYKKEKPSRVVFYNAEDTLKKTPLRDIKFIYTRTDR